MERAKSEPVFQMPNTFSRVYESTGEQNYYDNFGMSAFDIHCSLNIWEYDDF